MPSKKLLRSLILLVSINPNKNCPLSPVRVVPSHLSTFMPPGFWDVDNQILLQQHMAWIFVWMEWNYVLKKMAQASQRFWLFCFTLGQEAEEWNLLLLQAQLGKNWFFVCFSGPKWRLTGDHCMNNPQLTPHFLRGSNDARSYPKKTSICQRWFKFTQKFQGIQKSNMFARKSIVVIFFSDAFWSKQSKRMACWRSNSASQRRRWWVQRLRRSREKHRDFPEKKKMPQMLQF